MELRITNYEIRITCLVKTWNGLTRRDTSFKIQDVKFKVEVQVGGLK